MELPKDQWLTGQFEGKFEHRDGKLNISSGQITQAYLSTQQPPLNSEDQLEQTSLAAAKITFAESSKTLSTDLSQLLLNQYSLSLESEDAGASSGVIKGTVWAKAGSAKKQSKPWWLILAALILLALLNWLAPLLNSDEHEPQAWRRLVNPLLPSTNDLLPNQNTGKASPGDGSGSPGDVVLVEQGWALCRHDLKMKSDALFDYDSSDLLPEASQLLEEHREAFEFIRDRQLKIRVIGHTDTFGSQSYNRQLSQKRAKTIADWLRQEIGLEEAQMIAVGWGESDLLVASGTKEEQAPNRRVSIKVLCSDNGIPISYLTAREIKVSDSDSQYWEGRHPWSPAPESSQQSSQQQGLKITEALRDPETFFNRCDQPLLLSADVLFDFDRASLRPKAVDELKLIEELLLQAQDPVFRIEITGHTDTIGSEDHNLRLSLRRAQRVARWLTDNTSLSEAQIEAKGMGESAPIAGSGESERNRRVEILVLCEPSKPKGEQDDISSQTEDSPSDASYCSRQDLSGILGRIQRLWCD